MERFVIVMPVDTSAYLLPCDDGDTCKLETLQKLVGGPIEMADTCLAASWAREDVDSIQMAVNEEGLLQELPYNEHATDLYAFNYMSSIVGPAVLMAARGDELIGFAKSVAESIDDGPVVMRCQGQNTSKGKALDALEDAYLSTVAQLMRKDLSKAEQEEAAKEFGEMMQDRLLAMVRGKSKRYMVSSEKEMSFMTELMRRQGEVQP